MKKVAGYIRVSTILQAEEGESLTTQRQQISEFVKQRKNPLPWTHQDHLEIINALKQRDPEKAKQAIVNHRVKARDAFLGKRVIDE